MHMMAHIPRPRTIPPKNDNPSNPFLGTHGVGVVGVGEDESDVPVDHRDPFTKYSVINNKNNSGKAYFCNIALILKYQTAI